MDELMNLDHYSFDDICETNKIHDELFIMERDVTALVKKLDAKVKRLIQAGHDFADGEIGFGKFEMLLDEVENG